ncbi:MAG: hypothetical protein HYZ65_01920 [Burkholderiales bacterium]|nr:hypothetical protein [Burkholderiales bacterium]
MDNQIDDSIPLLTEIIPPELDMPAATGLDEAAAQQQSGSISEEDWHKLEQTLREDILRQVLSRIDFVLEHRVRDSLADVLQTAVENLAIEIRSGLHQTMDDVIRRAVTQEIAKAKSIK